MQREDLDKLGFKEKEKGPQASGAAGGDDGDGGPGEGKGGGAFYDGRREAEGFVAGTGVKSGRKGFFS